MTIDLKTLEANRACPYGGSRHDCPCAGNCFYRQFTQFVADLPAPTVYVDGKPVIPSYIIISKSFADECNTAPLTKEQAEDLTRRAT